MAIETINDLKRAKADKVKVAKARLDEIMHAAEAENREQTPEERADVERLLEEARAVDAKLKRREGDVAQAQEIERLTGGGTALISRPADGSLVPAGQSARRIKTWGEQFAEADAFREFIRRGGHRNGQFTSPAIEVFTFGEMQAATLTTDAASGGAAIVPQQRPGILTLLFRRVLVADLIAPGTTDSPVVNYVQETGFTNAADTVAEGAAKPESAITFGPTSDTARKIAHWLPTSEEMLQDVPQIRSFIDTRLRLGVELAEDDQLLNGSGVAPDFMGIRNRTGLAADIVRDDVGGENNMDAILRQITAIATTALMNPDGIVMNPTNWFTIATAKDSAGDYIGNGPFDVPIAKRLWGLPVSDTPAEPLGVATVGAFAQAAQFFRYGGLRIDATNSHADFFIRNLVAIRAEERGILAVYRPAAFGDVTTLE